MTQFHYAPATDLPETRRRYEQRGYLESISIGTRMLRNREEFGSLPALLDGDVTLSWRELVERAARFGGYLKASGIGPGDVVLWQLPNWWEATVVAYGIWAAGAISAPVVPIYRELELRTIIAAVTPRAVVVPKSFHGTDHVELISACCAAEGGAPPVRVTVRGQATGWTSFEDTITTPEFFAENVHPDAPALVAFTSGTTSGAKGVVHSTASFMSSAVLSTRVFGFGWRDRSYMPAPIGHSNGLLSAIARPLVSGCSVVVRDRWDPDRAIDDIRDRAVTFSAGATVFMRELLAALAARGEDRLPLRAYPCGGATVPAVLAYAADAAGLNPSRGWGMTECPAVTTSGTFLPARIRCETDGAIAPGCEVCVIGDDGRDVAAAETGELLVRGPQRALGYISAADTAGGFDAEGWFHTGDLGFVDADGAVTMTGRIKEIINRGGEKISGREIEELLLRHPEVVDAAVVPAPHERLGEQPAAYLVTRHGRLNDAELEQFLESAGLTRRKIPRVWRYVDALPRTASGKVRKTYLADMLAAGHSDQEVLID